ncbi:PaaI family thioesterase [Nocardioides sp. YIM 152315]|uniref:PaaI family thioesterase n=1 Tax=Nocardioides sp. YIM 152315 TaxID=3031760 RepID=UPI0023DC83CF|nr:PaaI family thioesterase [Nocardioides sp. YIM 152315]MDF1605033.1 PaaI family thioesterase [Nocardioides sp. YIM 152315]
MPGYQRDDLTAEQIEQQKSLYDPFTDAVRELVDAAIRTEVGEDEIRTAQAEVEGIVARLRRSQLEGSYGVRFGATGRGRPWGNAVVGVRNAVAPPLVVERDDSGRAWSDFHLGAAYEGPPGLVHGGVSALILDQMLGEAAGAGGKPGMTATLTLHYRRGTPLGDLRAEAWIERSEGIKTWARGHVSDTEGVTVEAEGLFILPRWAREQLAADEATPKFFE